jgi:hypothetical protein
VSRMDSIKLIIGQKGKHPRGDWTQFCQQALTQLCAQFMDRHINSPIEDLKSFSISSPEELGEIVEALLSTEDQKKITTQKSTGSYFSSPELIQYCTQQTLSPLLEQCALERDYLKLKICDPSCGSGLFLVSAAQLIFESLKQQFPQSQYTISDVITNCIYGVDIQPICVTSARLSLWLLSQDDSVLESSKQTIRCGDSLMGCNWVPRTSPIRIEDFSPLIGDNKRLLSKHRKAHKLNLGKHSQDTWLPSIDREERRLRLLLIPRTSEAPPPTHTQDKENRPHSNYHGFHWFFEFPKVAAIGGFDAILTNPPYVDSETLKRLAPRKRDVLRILYPWLKGNWDLFIPFVGRCLELTRKDGRLGIITPTKLIATDYAVCIQDQIKENTIEALWLHPNTSLFKNANLRIMCSILSCSSPEKNHNIRITTDEHHSQIHCFPQSMLSKLPRGHWSILYEQEPKQSLGWLEAKTTLGDLATVRDGASTSEAYEIRKFVVSKESFPPSEECIKLINTGSIDPFKILWEEKKTRYLGFNGKQPVISASEFKKHFPKRYEQALQEHVSVAGLSKRIEAVVVPSGVYAAKSTVNLFPKSEICPHALCAYLNSDSTQRLYRQLYQGRSMGMEALNIGPRQLENLPCPEPKYFNPSSQNHSNLSQFGYRLSTTVDSKTLEELERWITAFEIE